MGDQSVVDKSLRSVFVGNIPYEVTEEKLKEIFSEVGPVVSFKLVFDRDSGKPKGYGFCEYKDQETALSAMRNLNNYEIAGRTLRVDNACTEKSRMEMQSLMQAATTESIYGESVPPEKAPETISKAVASLPPEQMYELMKQMKHCIQNNPAEARQMLLQNPQLAYALLQAQIVMRIIDPQTALTMLHTSNQISATSSSTTTNDTVISSTNGPTVSATGITTAVNNSNSYNSRGPPSAVDYPTPVPPPSESSHQWNNVSSSSRPAPTILPSAAPPPLPSTMDLDMRETTANRFADQDLRIPPNPMMAAYEQFGRDPRTYRAPAMVQPPGPIPMPPMPPLPQSIGVMPSGVNLPISRGMAPSSTQNAPLPRTTPTTAAPSAAATVSAAPLPTAKAPAPSNADSEKAALIMQVLQLTDEQIAMLPAEQRHSILILKEQIAKSSTKR